MRTPSLNLAHIVSFLLIFRNCNESNFSTPVTSGGIGVSIAEAFAPTIQTRTKSYYNSPPLIKKKIPSKLEAFNNDENNELQLQMQGEDQNDYNNDAHSNEEEYTIQFTIDQQTVSIPVKENETILTALERYQNAMLPSNTSSPTTTSRKNCQSGTMKNRSKATTKTTTTLINTSTIPSSCRRGNCMTCTAKHLPSSNRNAIATSNNKTHSHRSSSSSAKLDVRNGLSPGESDRIIEDGWVLICSTKVQGDGVKLEIVGEDVWGSVFADDDEGKRIRDEAMAKTIRMADEHNLQKWASKTERMLQNPRGGGGGGDSNTNVYDMYLE